MPLCPQISITPVTVTSSNMTVTSVVAGNVSPTYEQLSVVDSDAQQALADATQALADAAAAQADANTAIADATQALTDAAAAQADANTAISNAASAQSTANTALSNAAAAQSSASTALANAATAQSSANTALANAATAQSTANTALTNASSAYTAAVGSLQPSASTIVNASNQITAINGTGITVYSGASATTGARVVLNSAGLAGFNSSSTGPGNGATFSINASTGAAVFSGSVTGSTITGGTLNIGGNAIIDSNGYLTATGATITGNITATTGTFTGTVIATTGSFTGTVTATTGTFTGTVIANTGTFTGTVIATTGTFTGAVYANTGSFTGTVIATTGTFTGTVFATTGSFTGTVTATTGTFTGTVIANTGTFTGTVIANTGSFTGTVIATTGSFTGTVITPNATITGGSLVLGTGNVTTNINSAGIINIVDSSSGLLSSPGVQLTSNGAGTKTYLGSAGLYFGSTSTTIMAIDGMNELGGYAGVPRIYAPANTYIRIVPNAGLLGNTYPVYIEGSLDVLGRIQLSGNFNAPNIPSTTSAANVRWTTGGTGQFQYVTSSSQRFKDNITDIGNVPGLDPKALLSLPVRAFTYKPEHLAEGDDRFDVMVPGFIAEEVDAVYPIATDYDENGPVSWNDRFVVPAMLSLIQDLYKEINALKGGN